MVDHFPPYLYTMRGTFYFSRRIPKDLLGYFSTPRIMCSLKTKKLELALRLARTFNEDLEAEWWQIRRRHRSVDENRRCAADHGAAHHSGRNREAVFDIAGTDGVHCGDHWCRVGLAWPDGIA